MLLRSTSAKAAHMMLMKSTPDFYFFTLLATDDEEDPLSRVNYGGLTGGALLLAIGIFKGVFATTIFNSLSSYTGIQIG